MMSQTQNQFQNIQPHKQWPPCYARDHSAEDHEVQKHAKKGAIFSKKKRTIGENTNITE